MNGYLVDTNVVSELRKAKPDPNVRAWSDAQAPHQLYLSAMTLAEIRYGIERQQGVVFSHPDIFIAATARVHGLAVCTRDERGFRKTGVSVVNPF